jgi:hypothetical protein
MEMKMAQATSSQVSRASQRHYDLESQIMNQLRELTLAQKESLATQLPGIIDKLK